MVLLSINSIICDWLAKRHGWHVSSETIVYTPGVMPGVHTALNAFSKPGDNILIQPPVYPEFLHTIKGNGRRLSFNQLVYGNGAYSIDFDDFEHKLAQAKIFLLCNPHNPIGKVWSEKELQQMAELCIEHKVPILSDEIHFDLVYGGSKHVSLASLSPDFADISITLTAASKTFNLAGLSTSFNIIDNKTMRARFDAAKHGYGFHIRNMFGFAALEAAYTQCDDWLAELLVYLFLFTWNRIETLSLNFLRIQRLNQLDQRPRT